MHYLRLVAVSLGILVAGAGCGDDTPTAPTPPVVEPDPKPVVDERPDPDPPLDIRPVHPEFDDRSWRQIAFDYYERPEDLSWRTTHVLTFVPNVWLWTLDDTAVAEEAIRRLLPLAYRDLTGRHYSGRIESGRQDRIEPGWITGGVRARRAPDQHRATALVGANPGRIRFTWDEWWHFGPGNTFGHWRFETTFRHEVGHALGFWHVSDPTSLMATINRHQSVRWFSAKDEYHARLAYEVGRGARYCGWPFSENCASASGLQPSFGPEPPVVVEE